MELTNRTRHAVTAMLELARAAQPLPVNELARRQAVSSAYLDKLLLRLCARGLLMRCAGAEQRFWLARPPVDVALADIVTAVHDRGDRRRRRGTARNRHGNHRLGHYLLGTLNQRIIEFLAGISLADLMTREQVFGNVQRRVRKPRLRAVPNPAGGE